MKKADVYDTAVFFSFDSLEKTLIGKKKINMNGGQIWKTQ